MEFCCFGKICSAKYSATFTGCYVVAESCTKTWSGQPHAMRRKLSNFVSLPFPRITFHHCPPCPWRLHQLAKKQGTGTCNIGGGVGENREDPQETHTSVVILVNVLLMRQAKAFQESSRHFGQNRLRTDPSALITVAKHALRNAAQWNFFTFDHMNITVELNRVENFRISPRKSSEIFVSIWNPPRSSEILWHNRRLSEMGCTLLSWYTKQNNIGLLEPFLFVSGKNLLL